MIGHYFPNSFGNFLLPICKMMLSKNKQTNKTYQEAFPLPFSISVIQQWPSSCFTSPLQLMWLLWSPAQSFCRGQYLLPPMDIRSTGRVRSSRASHRLSDLWCCVQGQEGCFLPESQGKVSGCDFSSGPWKQKSAEVQNRKRTEGCS